jgi:uncharacterized delta-60 repeat protein
MSRPGDLDLTFNGTGIVTTNNTITYGGVPTNFLDIVYDMAIQTDGKILVCGYAAQAADTNSLLLSSLIIVRYNVNGTIDTTFGIHNNGIVRPIVSDFNLFGTKTYSIKLTNTGKIIVAGSGVIDIAAATAPNIRINSFLIRYNSNGTVDTTFGTNGSINVDMGGTLYVDQINSIAIQRDDKIVVGGQYYFANGTFSSYLARFTANGQLDTTFGLNNNGIILYGSNNINNKITSLVILSNGEIIAGGNFTEENTLSNFYLRRYNTSGTTYVAFGPTDFFLNNDIIEHIELDNNENVVVVGHSTNGTTEKFTLARYTKEGTLDITFGDSQSGKIITDFFGNDSYASSLAIQSDGKIIVGGYTIVNGNYDFALARYEYNGALDKTFGPYKNGIVTTYITNKQDGIFSVKIQNINGIEKLIACGTSNTANINFANAFPVTPDIDTTIVVARYLLSIIPIVPVCFPKGTPVQTDQGIINIDKIDTKKHTIWNNKIVAITKSIPMQKHIICIEKHSLDKNVPLKDTYISMNHKLMYNNKMIEAKELVGKVEGIYTKKYNNEILYNILLEKHDVMIVNNLIVETLDPNNLLAKVYNSGFTEEEQQDLIVKINDTILNNDYNNYSKLCLSLNTKH